jgi:hypothetical protein
MPKRKLPLRPNVCMLVYNARGQLFLGERLRNKGHWQFPQGGAEPTRCEKTSCVSLKKSSAFRAAPSAVSGS